MSKLKRWKTWLKASIYSLSIVEFCFHQYTNFYTSAKPNSWLEAHLLPPSERLCIQHQPHICMSHDYCQHLLDAGWNEGRRACQPVCILQILLANLVTIFPRLPWNTYITSIPLIHDSSVAPDICHVTLRDGGKNHFESTCAEEEKAYCAFMLPSHSRRNKEYKWKDWYKETETSITQTAFYSAVLLFSFHRDTVSFTKMELSRCACYLCSHWKKLSVNALDYEKPQRDCKKYKQLPFFSDTSVWRPNIGCFYIFLLLQIKIHLCKYPHVYVISFKRHIL